MTVKFDWLDGKPAAYGAVMWTNLNTGESDGMDTENGKLTLKLPPGEYGFATQMATDNGDAKVYGVDDLAVKGETAKFTVDGRRAKPMKYNVDATDVEKRKLYGIPSKAERQGHKSGFALKAELTGPANAAKPYSYSLVDFVDKGIPADPSFTTRNDSPPDRPARSPGSVAP